MIVSKCHVVSPCVSAIHYTKSPPQPALENGLKLAFSLMSGAIKLDRIPTTKAGEELDYFDEGDYEVMNPLNHDLELLADLYEKCRRFAARRDEQK